MNISSVIPSLQRKKEEIAQLNKAFKPPKVLPVKKPPTYQVSRQGMPPADRPDNHRKQSQVNRSQNGFFAELGANADQPTMEAYLSNGDVEAKSETSQMNKYKKLREEKQSMVAMNREKDAQARRKYHELMLLGGGAGKKPLHPSQLTDNPIRNAALAGMKPQFGLGLTPQIR